MTGYLVNAAVVNGLNKKALSFNGFNSYMEVNNSAELNMTVFSVSLWFKLNLDNHIARLIGKGTNSTENFGFFIEKNFINKDSFGYSFFYDYSHHIGNGGLYSIQSDVWYNIVFVCDGVNSTFYLNGNYGIKEYNALQYYPTNVDPIILGIEKNNDGFQYPFNGSIDEVRLYNRSLSDVEASSLYFSNRPVTTPEISNTSIQSVNSTNQTNNFLFFDQEVINQISYLASFSLIGISVIIVVFTMSYYVKLRRKYKNERKPYSFSDFIKNIKRKSRQRKTIASLSDKTLKSLEDIIEENK